MLVQNREGTDKFLWMCLLWRAYRPTPLKSHDRRSVTAAST